MSSAIRPVVISGPSGVGKSTILKKLFSEYPDKFGFSVSHTTRPMRPGEIEGDHYHFTTLEQMKQDIEAGLFIEYAEFSGNMYGTSKEAVQNVLNDNRICILDVDEQGVKSIKTTDIDPFYVFIKPPSIEELESRLRSRGTETEETLRKRMSTAASAIKYGDETGVYDIVIINEVVEDSYLLLRDFLLKTHTSQNATNNNVASHWKDTTSETPLSSIGKLNFAAGDSALNQSKVISSVSEIPLSPSKSPTLETAAVFPVESPPLISTSQLNSSAVINMEEEPMVEKEPTNPYCGRNSCRIL